MQRDRDIVHTKEIWNGIYKKLAAMKKLQTLDFNTKSIRKRWFSMRRTFKITYENIKNGICIQPYVYYDLMDFLEPVFDEKHKCQQ
jgi:hypothetical protein